MLFLCEGSPLPVPTPLSPLLSPSLPFLLDPLLVSSRDLPSPRSYVADKGIHTGRVKREKREGVKEFQPRHAAGLKQPKRNQVGTGRVALIKGNGVYDLNKGSRELMYAARTKGRERDVK